VALQSGWMGCYCYDNIIKKWNPEFASTTFTDIDGTNNKKYCDIWLRAWSLEMLVKYGAPALISVINALVSNLFRYTAPFEKQFTMNDETSSTFVKLTILQFANVAVILLVQSLKFQNKFLNYFHVFDGSYGDFDMYWYADIGT
jgi:hypothetical protein